MSNQDPRGVNALHAAFKSSSASLLYADRQKNPQGFETLQSKMVKGEHTKDAVDDKDLITNPQHDVFLKNSVAKSIERIRDNQNILQLLPDIKQALEIIIGTVLSPKDMMNPTLTFKSTLNVFDDTAGPLLNYIQDYFVSSYKLEDKLTDMLWDVLGKTGSYPMAVLPETAVDYMINSNSRVTLEDITSSLFTNDNQLAPLGFLGNASSTNAPTTSNEELDLLEFMRTVSVENYAPPTAYDPKVLNGELGLSVIDNFDALKIPLLKNKVSRQASHDIVQSRRNTINLEAAKLHRTDSLENVQVVNMDYTRTDKDKRDLNKLYPDRQFKSTPVMRVQSRNTLKRETVGHPLALKLPTESVIPVFNPMDPRDHIGYFVMIDPSGNAVRLTELDNLYRMMQTSSNVTSSSNVMSYLIQQSANSNNAGGTMDYNAMSFAEGLGHAAPIYQQLVERELLDRISRGTYGTGMNLGNLEQASMIMLARALAGKHTQLLFVPSSVMAYIAIDYDEYGLGKTLLDDSKMLAALRSMNIVVNSIASSKNAITKRILNADLDPAEKNPQKAMQIIMQEYVKGTQAEYPLTNNPVDQINYLQMAGVQVNVGEHPRLPSTKIGVDYIDNQYKPIDTTWDEWLKKLHTQATGLSPEVVEGAGAADFATQTVLANVLTARRIDLISSKFTNSLSNFVQLYTYNSQILFDALVELIKTNKIRLKDAEGDLLSDEQIAVMFIESIEVSLPPPDTTKVKEQKEAFTEQEGFYEEALKYFFDPEFLTEEDLGRLGGMDFIDKHRKFIKAYFMRNWMKDNGMMGELFDMIGVDRHGKPLIDFNEKRDEYMEQLAASLLPMMKKAMKRSGDINAVVEKYEEGLTNPPAEDTGGSSGYSEPSPEGNGDDFDTFEDSSSDMPDLDTMDDATMEESSTTEETTSEEEKNPDDTSNEDEQQ